MKQHFKFAVDNIAKFGDTDVFPYPIENHIFFDKPNEVVEILNAIHKDFDSSLVRIPPVYAKSLSVVGYSGFRPATQIDPIWNAYLLAKDKENDDRKRAAVAQEWTRLFKVEIKPEDINCDGCLSDGGRVFNYCKVCEIRKCGKEKALKNCGYCGEYPCHKLDFIFRNAPDKKNRLDKINSSFK